MYAHNNMIVICCDSDKDSPVFSGVIVHSPEKGIDKIGQYLETFVKFYFNPFEGEVTLRS